MDKSSPPSSPNLSLRLRVPQLPIAAVILLILQQIIPSKPLMALGVITTAMWLVSAFWARSLASGLRIERERRYGWGQVGDVFEERIVLKNDGIFPALWLLIEDNSTLTGHSISLGTGIGGRGSRNWIKRTACTSRGEYQLGPTSIESSDLFGLYRVRIEYSDSVDFVVAPPVIGLPMALQITSGHLLHDHRFARRMTEASTVSASTREFAPGDSLLRIHWLTTARRDTPFVRHFENIHASDSCWIILDMDHGVHARVDEEDSIENGIILAVSLADRFLKDGLAVGVLAKGKQLLLVPPAKGVDQFRLIQRSLATIQPGEEPLGELLLRFWAHLRDQHNLVAITPSQETDWLDTLTQMRRSQVRPTVFMLTGGLEAEGGGGFGEMFTRRGVKVYPVPPEIFRQADTAPGRQGLVEWRFTPMGRAIKVVEGERQ